MGGGGAHAQALLGVQVEGLLEQAGQLEDKGQVDLAISIYEKALVMDPDNHELRQYINRLVAQVNTRRAEDQLKARREEQQVRWCSLTHSQRHDPGRAEGSLTSLLHSPPSEAEAAAAPSSRRCGPAQAAASKSPPCK